MAWEVYGEGGGQFNNLKDAKECAKQFSMEGSELDGYGEPGEVSIWKDGTLYFTYKNGKVLFDGWSLTQQYYKVKNLETLEDEEITTNKQSLKIGHVYRLSDGRRIQVLEKIKKLTPKNNNDDSATNDEEGGDDGSEKKEETLRLGDILSNNNRNRINLNESFETHDTLNSRLFNLDNNKLKEDVRIRLNEIANLFVENIQEDEVPLKVYDYWLVGSNAAYNYNKDSDIDIHIIVDMEDVNVNPYLLRLLYDYIKSSFNDKYEIMVKGHEVELYLEDIKTTAVTNGVYSIKQDKWIKVPTKVEVKKYEVEDTPLYNEIYKKFSELSDEQAEQFLDDLYILRKESLISEGEFGLGNLIFKEFRNKGYIQELKDMKYRFKSQELTLENLNFDNCDREGQ